MVTIQRDPVVSTIIGAAIEVHRSLGPGLVEGVYQVCLAHDLRQRGIQLATEVALPVMFKGVRMDCGFRLDLLVDGDVIVEVKSVETLTPIHTAQVLTYLRLTDARQALLFNFNCVTLIEGLKSFLGRRNVGSQPAEQPAAAYPQPDRRRPCSLTTGLASAPPVPFAGSVRVNRRRQQDHRAAWKGTRPVRGGESGCWLAERPGARPAAKSDRDRFSGTHSARTCDHRDPGGLEKREGGRWLDTDSLSGDPRRAGPCGALKRRCPQGIRAFVWRRSASRWPHRRNRLER